MTPYLLASYLLLQPIHCILFIVDCKYLYDNGYTDDGEYTINPDDTTQFQAYCSEGWTVFQRRVDDTVDFRREWDDYVAGFGHLEANYWAGLDKIHAMTGNDIYDTELQVNMESFENESATAMYSSFTVGDASSGYLMSVSGYTGDAGDSFTYHSNMKFSTKDHDQDRRGNGNCAEIYNGGWWYNYCYHTNPNGLYGYGKVTTSGYIMWNNWKGYRYSLKSIQFKIRRI